MNGLRRQLRRAGVSRWRARRYRRPWALVLGVTDGLPEAWANVDTDDIGVRIHLPVAVATDGAIAPDLARTLDALFDARPERPLDAIVLRVPAGRFRGDVAHAGAPLSEAMGRALALIRARTGMRAPVYCVVDACRAGWPGFGAIAERANHSHLLGWSAPALVEAGADPRWNIGITSALARDAATLDAAEFAADAETDQTRALFALWIASLFPPSPDRPPPWLRGVYLADEAVFTADLFTRKIWPEAGLAVATGRAAEATTARTQVNRPTRLLIAALTIALVLLGSLVGYAGYTAARDVPLADAAAACTATTAQRQLAVTPDGALLDGLTQSPLPFDLPIPLAFRFLVPDGTETRARLRAGLDALLAPIAHGLDADLDATLSAVDPALDCVPPRVESPRSTARYGRFDTRAELLADRERYRRIVEAREFAGLADLVAPFDIETGATDDLDALYDTLPDAPPLADGTALIEATLADLDRVIEESFDANRLVEDLEGLRAAPTSPAALRTFAERLARAVADLAEPDAAWPAQLPDLETPMAIIAAGSAAALPADALEARLDRWQRSQVALGARIEALRAPTAAGPAVLAREAFALTERLTALVEPLAAFYADPLLQLEAACGVPADACAMHALPDDTAPDAPEACPPPASARCPVERPSCKEAMSAVADAPSLTADLDKAVGAWPELQIVGRRAIRTAAVAATQLKGDPTAATTAEAKTNKSLELVELVESLKRTDPARARDLSAQLTAQALTELRTAREGLRTAYRPKTGWSTRWTSAEPPVAMTTSMFGAGNDDALAEWLAAQGARVAQTAESLEPALVLVDGLGKPGTEASEFIFWTQTKATDPTAIDGFVTDLLSAATPGACPSLAELEVPDGVDLYGERQRALVEEFLAACQAADYARVQRAFDSEPRAFVEGAPHDPAALRRLFDALDRFVEKHAEHAPASPEGCGWQFIDALRSARGFFSPLAGDDPVWQLDVRLRRDATSTPVADRAVIIGDTRRGLFDQAALLSWRPGDPITVALRWADSGARMPVLAIGAEIEGRTVRWTWNDRWVLWRLLDAQAEPSDGPILLAWPVEDALDAEEPQRRTVVTRMQLTLTDPATKAALTRAPAIPAAVTPGGAAPADLTTECPSP